jgi:hypothetical protein
MDLGKHSASGHAELTPDRGHAQAAAPQSTQRCNTAGGPGIGAARRQSEPARLAEDRGLGDTQLASDRRIRLSTPKLAQLGDAVGGPERWAPGPPSLACLKSGAGRRRCLPLPWRGLVAVGRGDDAGGQIRVPCVGDACGGLSPPPERELCQRMQHPGSTQPDNCQPSGHASQRHHDNRQDHESEPLHDRSSPSNWMRALWTVCCLVPLTSHHAALNRASGPTRRSGECCCGPGVGCPASPARYPNTQQRPRRARLAAAERV